MSTILSFLETFEPPYGILMRSDMTTEEGQVSLLYYFDDPKDPRGIILLTQIDNFVATSLVGETKLHPIDTNGKLIQMLARVTIEPQTATIYFHKPATDEFLMVVRKLWGDTRMSFSEWTGRITGANHGILQDKEIERLLQLQNFEPNPNPVGSKTDDRYPDA